MEMGVGNLRQRWESLHFLLHGNWPCDLGSLVILFQVASGFSTIATTYLYIPSPSVTRRTHWWQEDSVKWLVTPFN